MGQIAIRADKYFNNKNKMDMLFGEENITPVDLNAGYIAQKADKFGQDDEIGETTQQNIRERFSLETPDIPDDEGGED